MSDPDLELVVTEQRYPFRDVVNTCPDPFRQVTLIVQSDTVGVEHQRLDDLSNVVPCDDLADVSFALDAFFCRTCGRNGRISGAWALDRAEEGA